MSNPAAHWAVIQLRRQGPVYRGSVSAEEITAALSAGTLAWTDLVFQAGKTMNWTRACDLEDFRAAFPPLPDGPLLDQYRKAYLKEHKQAEGPSEVQLPDLEEDSDPPTIEEASIGNLSAVWYFQFEGSEYGPVTRSQLQDVLQKGNTKGELHVWRQGLKAWMHVKTIQEFAQLIGAQHLVPAKAPQPVNAPPPQSNLRSHSRHALIATVFLVIGEKWKRTIGVCADISLTGMQVLLDSEAEFSLGQEYQFEIQPAASHGVPAFNVAAKAVWLRGEERRAGFVFLQMKPDDQASLMKCLSLKLTSA